MSKLNRLCARADGAISTLPACYVIGTYLLFSSVSTNFRTYLQALHKATSTEKGEEVPYVSPSCFLRVTVSINSCYCLTALAELPFSRGKKFGCRQIFVEALASFRFLSSNQKLARALTSGSNVNEFVMLLRNFSNEHRWLGQFSEAKYCHQQALVLTTAVGQRYTVLLTGGDQRPPHSSCFTFDLFLF